MGGHWLQGLQVYGKQGTILHSQLLDPKVVSEVKYFLSHCCGKITSFAVSSCHQSMWRLCSIFLNLLEVCWLVFFFFFFPHVLWHLITCWRHLSFPWSIKFHWWGSVQTSVWHSLLTPGLISFTKFTMSPRYACIHLHAFFLKSHNPITSSILFWVLLIFFATLAHFFLSFMLSSILLLEWAFIPFVRSNQISSPISSMSWSISVFPGGIIISAQYVFFPVFCFSMEKCRESFWWKFWLAIHSV